MASGDHQQRVAGHVHHGQLVIGARGVDGLPARSPRRSTSKSLMPGADSRGTADPPGDGAATFDAASALRDRP